MEQRIVNFFSEGTKMEGDLFLPSDLKSAERRPVIVLCHGFTGIRSMILDADDGKRRSTRIGLWGTSFGGGVRDG
jgi:dienelactone hydrolase